MRPSQWVKNGFVLAAPIFALRLTNPEDLIRSALAFIIFCVLTSGVYLWNDILDCEQDKTHPEKKNRPIASGKLSPPVAFVVAVAFLALSLFASFYLHANFGWVCVIYLGNNLLYTYFVKRLVILDVISIATGFVLRAMAGAQVVQVDISTWLILCTFLLALFLGFSKRRHEMELLQENAVTHRVSLEEYSPHFLDIVIPIVTASTVLSYALYTVSDETTAKFETENLIYTTLFVIYGILRYLHLVYRRSEGGNPTRVLFNDLPLKLTILCWLAVSTWIIYS